MSANGNGTSEHTLSENDDLRSLAMEGAATAISRRAAGRSVVTGKRGGAWGAPTPPGNGTAFPEWTLGTQVAGMFQSYAPLAYMLPWSTLDYIELLATYNPDFSQAVDNVKTLANSGHNLFVQTRTNSQRANQEVHDFLVDKSRTINERGGGIDGLIDQLLDQAATFGGMCGEWVVDDGLSDVTSFTVINPKHIRFFWDYQLADWAPFQKVNVIQQDEAKARGQEVRNGCVRLNELTFHYYAFDAAPGSPYGTPPFLAALPNIAIQRDMIDNMSQIVKKVGLLGIVDMMVKSLPPKPGETDSAYQSRAGSYLDNYVKVVEDMVRDGGVVHFDDVETKTFNITGNAAGATNIFKQNEELIFSGLKSMPSVQGRSYCVVPETRVLTSDLEWVEAGKLCLDDELIGFDEDLGQGRGSGAVARMKPSLVQRNERRQMHCYTITTDKGSITVTDEHPLVAPDRNLKSRRWYRADELRVGDRLVWVGEPWETDRSYDAGYLAGVFDGEGSLGLHGSGKNGSITMSQRSGAVLDETVMALKRLGFEAYVSQPCGGTNGDVCHVRLLGGKWETLRFLGQVRPHRLLNKAEDAWNGAGIRNGGSVNQTARKDSYATVVSIEDAGVREVVCLQTSSRTFIAEGLLNHNSTTETYAGVAYDIIIRNTFKYQNSVRRMIEAGYWLMATLAGYEPHVIRLEFKPNKSLHRLQDAQSQRLEIFNALVLWVCGFLDQTGAAQLLGYQAPVTSYDEPPESPLLGQFPTIGTSAKGADGNEETNPQPAGKSVKSLDVESMVEQITEQVVERVVSEISSRLG